MVICNALNERRWKWKFLTWHCIDDKEESDSCFLSLFLMCRDWKIVWWKLRGRGRCLFGVNFKIKLNLVIRLCQNVLEDCIICIWLFYCGNSNSWQIVSVQWGPSRQDLWLFLTANSKISSSSSSLFLIQFQFNLISLSHRVILRYFQNIDNDTSSSHIHDGSTH